MPSIGGGVAGISERGDARKVILEQIQWMVNHAQARED